MESLIEHIWNIYGMAGVTVFMFVLIGLKFNTEIKAVLSKIFSSKVDALLYEPKAILRSKLAYWLEFKIPTLEMSEYGRSKIFRDLMTFKFQAVDRILIDIEGDEGFADMSRNELYRSVISRFHNIIEDYESKAKLEGIPSVVIAKFKKWHTPSLEYTLKSAELITQSPIYKTNYDIMNAIYLLYISFLELSIAEAEKALSELNGELTGIEYKGYTIG